MPAFDGGAKDAGEFGRGGGQVHGFVYRLGPAGLEAGEVQQGVDECLQAQAIAMHHLELRVVLWR
jgi:hypothetical protein